MRERTIEAFSPMALHVHRATGDVIGRPAELAAIHQELSSASSGRVVALTLEGGYDLAALRSSAGATVRGLLEGRHGPNRA